MSDSTQRLDVAALRKRLEGARGRDYWRSLDELSATPEFKELVEREFPRQAVGWSEDENPDEGRRNLIHRLRKRMNIEIAPQRLVHRVHNHLQAAAQRVWDVVRQDPRPRPAQHERPAEQENSGGGKAGVPLQVPL